MTLLEHWRFYLKDIKSPQSFVDWGFYFLISSALQRRVWTSSDDYRIFPNLFIVFVAKPATGKGLAIRPVKAFLKHHPMYTRRLDSVQASKLSEATQEVDAEAMKVVKTMLNPPLLFPCAADCTTFEALTEEVAMATRTHAYHDAEGKRQIYMYASIAIMLTEMSNLLKEKKDIKILKFILDAYDCVDFRYRTKHQGEDCLKNPSLTFLAAVQPKVLRDCFVEKLLDDGFSSRAQLIYEEYPRHNIFGIPDPSREQLQSGEIIKARLLQLHKLYGKVEFSSEAWDHMKHWFENIFHGSGRINTSEKLDEYYGRMELHVQKLAMCIHFSMSDSLVVGLDSILAAIHALGLIEPNMHKALEFKQSNPLADVQDAMYTYIHNRGAEGVPVADTMIEFMPRIASGRRGWDEIVNNLIVDLRLVTKSIVKNTLVFISTKPQVNGHTVKSPSEQQSTTAKILNEAKDI